MRTTFCDDAAKRSAKIPGPEHYENLISYEEKIDKEKPLKFHKLRAG